MLILAGTEIITREIEMLMLCTNLIKLDISSNTIISFPKNFTFASMQKLKLFYLHNNLIDDLESI